MTVLTQSITLMRNTIIIIFIILLQSRISSIYGQELSIPAWIKGEWNRPYENNSNNFELWIFKNDSIIVGNGLSGYEKKNQVNLIERHKGYKITVYSTDQIYRINFTKPHDTATYEFKLQRLDYSSKLAMSYALINNGKYIRQHSTSCNLVLIKLSSD